MVGFKDHEYIYHLTHIDNIDGILEHGLQSRDELFTRTGVLKNLLTDTKYSQLFTKHDVTISPDIKFSDFKPIYENLIKQLNQKKTNLKDLKMLSKFQEELIKNLPVTSIANEEILEKRSKQKLESYVPFHFMYINATQVKLTCTQKLAQKMVYICVDRPNNDDNTWKVIPIHPLSKTMEIPPIMSYKDGLEMIKWEYTDNTKSKFRTTDNNLAKQTRMAECLYPDTLPVSKFKKIYTFDETTANIVNGKIKNAKKVNEEIAEEEKSTHDDDLDDAFSRLTLNERKAEALNERKAEALNELKAEVNKKCYYCY